uniref:Peptidase C1A papain C-terminal domain-containing protein n=1 Tax=Oryza meridionalis TaxID=40149 RepID=A0A0E0E6U0_9ORYZ
MRRQPPDATCASRQRRPGAACSSQIRHGGAGSTRGEAGSGRGGAGSAAPTSRSRVVLRGSRPSTRRDGAPSRPSLAAAILAGRTELRRRRGEGEEERVAAAAALGFPRVARAWATRGSRRLECFKVIRVVSYRLPWEGKSQKPDHIVLLTGYDADEEGAKFWTIKNSWGKHWGHGGYGKLERGSNDPRGTCGIL